MTAAVSLENVHKTYDKVPVVNNLSFSIESGEMFGLLGLKGTEKSTTIRIAANQRRYRPFRVALHSRE